ncbi:hypothetical protein [Rufibacter roseus]|uniref:Uncharacterized protein n=1 Tax=Rufibacter roseus TaxID=1567108 RepID=A0ABW2DS38_9BACT|nr:hypothetical protein [Rufibacter roseus]
MSDATLTALATVLLVIVGLAQVFVLISQKRQTRIALITEYRQLWNKLKPYWGNVIFIGRVEGEYYQVVNNKRLSKLKELTDQHSYSAPTIWALESVQNIFGLLGEVSTRILQGHLTVSDTYPIFGTGFLRQSRPLRQLLEPSYQHYFSSELESEKHSSIRNEMQDWLVYHDGLRRRCLILIDLLWAEAARLEDLPPDEMQSAANSKKVTGKLNRTRVFSETIRINGLSKLLLAIKLSRFLLRAEYFSRSNWLGIKKSRLSSLDANWTNRLLRS